jgi:hypothetical protein
MLHPRVRLNHPYKTRVLRTVSSAHIFRTCSTQLVKKTHGRENMSPAPKAHAQSSHDPPFILNFYPHGPPLLQSSTSFRSAPLNIKRHPIPLHHRLSPTRESRPLTPNLHQPWPRYCPILPLLLLTRQICITHIAMHTFRLGRAIMRIALMSVFRLQELGDTRCAQDMSAGNGDGRFSAVGQGFAAARTCADRLPRV